MAAVIMVATACAGGIAFYVRFLIALLMERRRAAIGMLVRLNTVAVDEPPTKVQSQPTTTAHAA